jgi:small-conductance mechanosensitive channel
MPALKQGQKVTLDGRSGTIEQAGAFSVILRDDQGKTVVIPTKNVVDKEIVIESGPKPETTEQKVESQTADLSTPSSFKTSEAA